MTMDYAKDKAGYSSYEIAGSDPLCGGAIAKPREAGEVWILSEREIEFEALSQLSAEALQLGAIAIVGLRVDHDEISGAGKSMMMVTAMGTAVRGRRLESNKAGGETAHPQHVSAEDLVKEMLRPMLKSWLDDNLPGLVDRIVRAEIERVSRGR